MKQTLFALAALGGVVQFAHAQDNARRATMMSGGNPNEGKCTIEVVVDGAAEVEIRGDRAFLRNVWGQPAQWRRFECRGILPRDPVNFRFRGIDGRGRQELIRDPRGGGPAVIRIEDKDGGAEGYTFDIMWSGDGAGYTSGPPNYNGPGYSDGPRDPGPPPREYGAGPYRPGKRFTTEEAVRVCQDAIRDQARDRFRGGIEFQRTALDDNPGRRDWIVGTFVTRPRFGPGERYRFSCSVDFDSGRVRTASIDRR